MANLAEIFRKIVIFLKANDIDYLIIGGVASATLGYPRLTQDVDICIFIKRKEISEFLKKVKRIGFAVRDKSVDARIRETGTFQIHDGKLHVDFLIATTEFEKSALTRRKMIRIYGINANFPTPEDLILFKIIPARYIDLADIENIAIRHKTSLDRKYLLNWARRLSDEAQDMRIYEDIKKVLQ